MRTREQIIADCEKRFEQLQAEKVRRDGDPRYTHPCRTCRWAKGEFRSEFCAEPMVKGFGQPHFFRPYSMSAEMYRNAWRDDEGFRWNFPKLCGPEKALWQSKPSLLERFVSCFERLLNV